MTILEMHQMFKVLGDKNDTSSTVNFTPEEVDLFLNLAIREYSTVNYTGSNVKRIGFEQNEKRKTDLKNLISMAQYTTSIKIGAYPTTHRFFELPNDFWIVLAESIVIAAKACTTTALTVTSTLSASTSYILTTGTARYAGTTYSAPDIIIGNGTAPQDLAGELYPTLLIESTVMPTTLDKVGTAKKDPFNKPSDKRVLRLLQNNYSELIGTNEIIPYIYTLHYYRVPATVSFENEVDCDLHPTTHEDIVRMAVLMALEPMESRRYNTMQNEIIKQE